MQTENLKSFFVWYVITCHVITYWASRNRFSAVSFHDYLHYFGIFLSHFLMKIDRNIISSLHIVFSLCTRVWCLYRFHQHNKNRWKCRCKREYHKVYNMRNIWETIDSFPRGPYYHLFKRYVFILLTKMRTETKTVPSTWYIFDVCRSHHINLPP